LKRGLWYLLDGIKKVTVTPAISVVMSVYNAEAYLKEAIESIISQTFKNFEFVIVDDGSTDSSSSIIKSYTDERIIFREQQNFGIARALNNGIKIARAQLIARMDADDIAYPDRLKRQHEFMQQFNDCLACGSWADIIDKDGNYVYTGKTKVDKEAIRTFFCKSISCGLPDTPFFHSSVMFRKEAFIMAGGYTDYMRRAQDVVLFNKMNKFGAMYNIPEVLIKYRIVPGSIGGKKMRSPSLGDLLIKAINDENIDERLINALEVSLSKSNVNEREYNYFLFLAKKYLFNNYVPRTARKNILSAMRINIFKPTPYLLLAVAFLPSSMITLIHKQKVQIQ
jgi:glycosyltransferase involved in cell wall biosynthesis